MALRPLAANDRSLIAAARDALRRRYRPHHHSVGAAVRTASGRVYAGINLDASPHGPCAEPIAMGAALTAGERIVGIVAVTRSGARYRVLPPCGSCRQLLADYAPGAAVITVERGKVGTAKVADLLPAPYVG